MVLNIAIKDFYNNIISARFAIGFILCLFLIPFSLFVSINDYKSQVRTYEVDKKASEEHNASVRVYSMVRPELVKPPEPLSIFSRGISYNVGNNIKVLLGEKPFMTTGKTLDRENPFLNSFFSMDFIGIIAVVMSLIAILFTYNLCSREREMGTLKLVLSNSVGRWEILLGKALGVFFTIMPIILFCFILCAVIILFYPSISFSLDEWIRVVLLFVMSILYILICMFIGMLISTLTRSSATSVVLCLFTWVLFVFIVPNLSVYTAQSMIIVQSQDNLRTGLNEIDGEFDAKYQEYRTKVGLDKIISYGSGSWYSDGGIEIGGFSPEYMEGQRQLRENLEPLRIDYADKKWILQEEYLNTLDLQHRWAERLSMISPSELYRLISSALCRTDVKSQYHFLNTVRRYRETLISFFNDEHLFSSFVYFTRQPPESFISTNERFKRLTNGKATNYEEWVAIINSPDYNPSSTEQFELPGADPYLFPPLDLSNVPQFDMEPLSIKGEFLNIVFKLSFMIISGIIFFYLSFLSFNRYDVR